MTGYFEPAKIAVQWGRFVEGLRFMVFDAITGGAFLDRQTCVYAALSGVRCAIAVSHVRVASTAKALGQYRVQSGPARPQ